ncbi:hypothetical protein B5807_08128 [Epicoccum nigrum]|uniref:P-loop containing nucleoside triphosphate hydrolase protein n=1 Tax=Epicoccum nigrum TaxID=105696 RepID=A0A1Y2LQ55_EPING|nr:hypothetical protein B5807_08128 [Epicoccum nigrum]
MATTSESKFSYTEEKSTSSVDEEQESTSQAGWKALFGFTTTSHIAVLISALASAAAAAAILPIFSVIYGLVFGAYSDYGSGKVNGDQLMSTVTRLSLIMTGVAAANWVFNSIFFSLFLLFGELQAKSARNRMFDVLIRKDIEWFDRRECGIAALLPTIQTHIRNLQLSVSAPFGEGIQCIIAATAAMGVAFCYSWSMTLVIICTVPVVYLIEAYLSKRLIAVTHEQASQLQVALKYITSAIRSIETVKCYNGQSYELHSFTKATSLAAKLYTRVANLRSMQIGVIHFFTFTVFVQGFAYGSHLVRSGSLDVSSVITTFWSALLAIGGVTGFLPQFIVMQKGKVSGARLRTLMDQITKENESTESQGQFKPSRCSGDIEFRRVTFSYPTRADEIALQEATLFFPAGETTFVIGKSGSGKSTLGQLLVRFYQPSSGQILLDHVSVSELDVQWLRQNVTLVEQHSILFRDSILNNITIGNQSGTISMDDVRNAVSFAMLDLVVESLPAGLHTNLEAEGGSLSGGQRQRMALARARIRDTPILILDESTSALDYVTRAAILHAIRQWRTGKTTIVITHDISQIQPEDFLYLLDKAKVVQEGYRRDLEADIGVFQSFLDTNEEERVDAQSESSSEEDFYNDQTDELTSSQRDSWIIASPGRRPLSAVLFGQSVLSSFHTDTTLHRSNTSDQNRSRPGRALPTSNEEHHLKEHSDYLPQVDYGLPKPPPEALSPVSEVFGPNQFNTARTSRTLFNDRSYMLKGKEAVVRPTSRGSTRPQSSHSDYSKRLSIATARTSYLSELDKKLRGKALRSGSSHGKSTDEPKLPADTLPIKHILRTIWPLLDWRAQVSLFAALLATLIHAVATPVFAWVFSQLLATFYSIEDTKAEAIRYAMIILGIAVIDGLAEYLMFYMFEYVAQSWTIALKTEAMRRILAQPREFFDEPDNNMTHLAETLDHFAEEARNLPGRFAGIFLSMFLVMAISVIWSLTISWKITLVALASGPIIFAVTQAYNMIGSHWENLTSSASDSVGQVLHETFVNIRTVRCLTLENHFHTKYRETTANAMNIGVKRAIYSGSIFGLLNTCPQFVIIALFWFGAWLIANKKHSVLNVTETFLILMLSINDISQMTQYMTQVNISRQAATRLLRLARLPETSHEDHGNLKLSSAGDISFSNVSFTYPTRATTQVLHNLSFSIPAGSCTAIVGPSGSGKSTIAALLLNLYPITQTLNTFLASEGRDLTISGQNMRTLHTATLRSRMAIVSQTPILFPGTIAQNIAYALSPSAPESGMESIRAAAHAAGVAEFIDSLPSGYHTLVGEGGTALSGGQAQRIAIARALVREPDLLILDEATSALDAIAAGAIRDTILRLVSAAPDRDETMGMGASLGLGASSSSRAAGVWGEGEGGAAGLSLSMATSPSPSPGWIRARGRGAKGKQKKKQMTVVIITHAREMMSVAEHVVMLDKGRGVEEGGYAELKRRRGGRFAKLLRGEVE